MSEPTLPGTEDAAAPVDTEPTPAKKAAAPKRDRKPRGPGRPSNSEKRTQRLAEQISSIGLVLAGLGAVRQSEPLAADAESVMRHAEPIAEALSKLADENKTVAKYLDAGMTGSAWLGLVMAVGGLGVEIASNHGALSGGADQVERAAGPSGASVAAGGAFTQLGDLLGENGAA